MPANEEIELKLSMDADAQARLFKSSLIQSLAAGPGKRKCLDSTYYDTPDLVLQRHGIALRLRHDGTSWVQTLKAPLAAVAAGKNKSGKGGKKKKGPAAAPPTAAPPTATSLAQGGANGLQHLREYETPVLDATPNLDLIDDADLQAFFRQAKVARDLEPVFTTRFTRETLPLAFADSRIELALDRGDIHVGDQTQPLCEVELELQAGRAPQLYEMAMLLHRQVSFRLEQDSKAVRGYNLYRDAVPTPQKADKPRLTPDMSVARAFTVLATACLRQIRANEGAVLDGRDLEGVHQMRVGIRRLRALVSAFGGVITPDARALLRTELRWMQQQLGSARDWDVFLAETVAPLRGRLPGARSLEHLSAESESFRATAYDQARAAVCDDRYTALLLHLELWLQTGSWLLQTSDAVRGDDARSLSAFARAILDKRARKMKKLGKRHESLNETDLHALRIRAKKLRYAVEFFAGLFPAKATKAYLSRLEAIQDALGGLNDAATGQELLDRLDREITRDTAAGEILAANGVGLVQGWQAARIARELHDFSRLWADFAACSPFWRGGGGR